VLQLLSEEMILSGNVLIADKENIMRKYKFIDFLIEEHAESNRDCLDDDMPDAFDSWLEDLDQDLLIKYADLYAIKCQQQVIKLIRERLAIPV
jgi:succinate dehydrogenase flavin-adding protein (antitoxin of CptAB toxin-antitoxin module)